MAYPVKVYPKNKGPAWLKGLDQFIEKPASEEVNARDCEATVRNHGGNKTAIDDDAYLGKGK
jgi:hypothetical protein